MKGTVMVSDIALGDETGERKLTRSERLEALRRLVKDFDKRP